MNGLTNARSWSTVNGRPCPQRPGILTKKALTIWTYSDTPSGIEQVRVIEVLAKIWVGMNHTEPLCPTTQFAPEVSNAGFALVGIENNLASNSALSFAN